MDSRAHPGQFDTYMEWIRAHSEPINAEAKKQGLILDYKAFVKPPRTGARPTTSSSSRNRRRGWKCASSSARNTSAK